MRNIYFPTTDFLAKLEISNSGNCEDRIDKDDVFFEIYNRPSYCNELLLSNFNNKLHKFFEAFPSLRKIKNKKIIRFFEYTTFNHKKPSIHQHIASGSNSWTLAYFFASLVAIIESNNNISGKYKNIVISGSIGEFTSWDQVNNINRVNEKLFVTAIEFFKNPELSDVSEIPFIYKSNEPVEFNSLIEKLRENNIQLEKHLISAESIKLTYKSRSIDLIKIDNVQDFLKIQYASIPINYTRGSTMENKKTIVGDWNGSENKKKDIKKTVIDPALVNDSWGYVNDEIQNKKVSQGKSSEDISEEIEQSLTNNSHQPKKANITRIFVSSEVRDDQNCMVGWLVSYSHSVFGEIYPLYYGKNIIGRGKGDYKLDIKSDDTISRENSIINVFYDKEEGLLVTIKDMLPQIPSKLNKKRISDYMNIADGDKITIGSSEFYFKSLLNIEELKSNLIQLLNKK